MSLSKNPIFIYEPTPLQCGQAVLAMLCDKSVAEIIEICKTERETTLKDMKNTLLHFGIKMADNRTEFIKSEELPEVAVLSLETPKCWHWSLYYRGKFFDPEYGLITEIPPAFRKYYWKIFEL